MNFQVVLRVHFPWLCASNNLIQVLLVDLVHGYFQVIPQALVKNKTGKIVNKKCQFAFFDWSFYDM